MHRKADMRATLLAALALALAIATPAEATPISVTEDTSRHPDSRFTYDLFVHNATSLYVYQFGITAPLPLILSDEPGGWTSRGDNPNIGLFCNGSCTVPSFNPPAGIAPGQTLEFVVEARNPVPFPSAVDWVAFAAPRDAPVPLPWPGYYQGELGYLSGTVDYSGTASVPEPSTVPLFATGLGLMAWLARRRRKIAVQAEASASATRRRLMEEIERRRRN